LFVISFLLLDHRFTVALASNAKHAPAKQFKKAHHYTTIRLSLHVVGWLTSELSLTRKNFMETDTVLLLLTVLRSESGTAVGASSIIVLYLSPYHQLS
jgi:hypothetical protein